MKKWKSSLVCYAVKQDKKKMENKSFLIQDDEPTDGPDFYFILSGFNTLGVLTAAEDINLSIDCIIKFRASSYEKIREFLKEIEERDKQDVPHKFNLRITCKIVVFRLIRITISRDSNRFCL